VTAAGLQVCAAAATDFAISLGVIAVNPLRWTVVVAQLTGQ
jgi:hypothetical protein